MGELQDMVVFENTFAVKLVLVLVDDDLVE
jgi:hypothetical protein